MIEKKLKISFENSFEEVSPDLAFEGEEMAGKGGRDY